MSITIGTVEITKNIEHDSSFWTRRKNQFTMEGVDGAFYTYDNSPAILEGLLKIKFVSKTQADALSTWLVNTIRFQLYSFTITPPSFNDLGEGTGSTILLAYYNGPLSTEKIITPVGRTNKFNINFPYRKIIVADVGTADQEGNIA